MLDAQSSIGGIPSKFVEEKKKELREKKERDREAIEGSKRFGGNRNSAADLNEGRVDGKRRSRWDSGDGTEAGLGAGGRDLNQAIKVAEEKAKAIKSRDEAGDERREVRALSIPKCPVLSHLRRIVADSHSSTSFTLPAIRLLQK